MTRKIRVAFIKFGGLAAGGTERWLQTMAANLPKDKFSIDYYYCDAALYVGSDYRHADTDPARFAYMQAHGVSLIEFSVGAKDITVPTHDWIGTDFWQIFDPSKYDLVQTAKAGPAEYPYFLLSLPVVEFVALSDGVDHSPNIAYSVHLSQWQRARWFQRGGNLTKSAVIPVPAEPPYTSENFRQALAIPEYAIVAGFHQRADENIYSPIPLQAFQRVWQPERHFIIMGGGDSYRNQAEQLGLKNVHFLPHSGDADRISRFLNTLDIFAHGRKDGETFGTVCAEAMIHGKPCLSHSSDIANAQPETMGPGGLFAQDEKDYERELQRLFSDDMLRKTLATKGERHALDYYTVNSCVNRLADIYTFLCPSAGVVREPVKAPTAYGFSDMGFLYAGNVDRQTDIAYCVMTGGCPDEFGVEILRYFLPHIKTMFDVGANTGLYAWIAAHEGDEAIKVHIFEPQPDHRSIMERTVFLNNWEEKVSIHATSLVPEQVKQTGHTDTLDHSAETLAVGKINFIKIDIEGAELAILEGAHRTLKQDRPVLFVRVATKDYRRTFGYLNDLNYLVMRVDDQSLKLEKVLPAQNNAPNRRAMYLCVPTEQWRLHEDNLVEARIKVFKRVKAQYRRKMMLGRLRQLNLWSKKLISIMRKLTLRAIVKRLIAAFRMLQARAGIVLQREQDSFAAHHAEYSKSSALERERAVTRERYLSNAANNQEFRLDDLIARNPQLKEIAVDIGAGAGWLSGWLAGRFKRVEAIEPSAAATQIATEIHKDKTGINRHVGLSEDILPKLSLPAPALFVTGRVLSHMTDSAVKKVIAAIDRAAMPGSVICLAELWGTPYHRALWHIRSKEWWEKEFGNKWELDFLANPVETENRFVGIHGVKTNK